jgi:hypothetical protein
MLEAARARRRQLTVLSEAPILPRLDAPLIFVSAEL